MCLAVVHQDNGVLPPGTVSLIEQEHQLQDEMVDGDGIVHALVAGEVVVASRADATDQADPG